MTDGTPEFLAQFRESYGHGYHTKRPDYSRCAEAVWSGSVWQGSNQCSRKNGHGPHGAWCKQHDPVARKAKQEASYAKWRAESENSARNREFAKAAQDAVRQIAAGHNDPRGLCAEILRKLEGGAE